MSIHRSSDIEGQTQAPTKNPEIKRSEVQHTIQRETVFVNPYACFSID